MHDFLKILMMISFFFFFFIVVVEKMMMVVSFFFFLLKMNETWANAPSLEHEFVSLGKHLDLIIFENNGASDDFKKTKT